MSIDNIFGENGEVNLAFLEDNVSFRGEVIRGLATKFNGSDFGRLICDPFGKYGNTVHDKTIHPIGRVGVIQAVAREISKQSDYEWRVAKPWEIYKYFSKYSSGLFGNTCSCDVMFLQTDSLFVIPKGGLRKLFWRDKMENEISSLIGNGRINYPFLVHGLNAEPDGEEFKFTFVPSIEKFTSCGNGIYSPLEKVGLNKGLIFLYRDFNAFDNRSVKQITWNTDEKRFYLNDDVYSNGDRETKTPLISRK